MKRSVVCTGLGMISSLGDNSEQIFSRLVAGESGIKLLPSDLSNGQPTVGGLIEADLSPWLTEIKLSGVDRISQLALAAAEMAMKDSNSPTGPAERTGCYFGTGMGGAQALESAYRGHFSESPRVSPLSVVASMTNAASAHIAMRYDVQGPVLNYSIACASSAVAIGEAYQAIASGRIDRALVGGAEALMVPGVIRAWQSMRTLAQPDLENPETSCRPFSVDRSGLVLAEGAAVMILEREDLAKARGASILAEVIGYGLACDSSHIAIPNSRGQIQALKMALESAGIRPRDVQYINTHGTATKVGDLVESQSIEQVWQNDLVHLRVSSTKSMHGHLLGAAGAFESAITILSLDKKIIPPTAFCRTPDPEIRLPQVLDKGQPVENLSIALNNSFAFGGTNAVLAFKRYR